MDLILEAQIRPYTNIHNFGDFKQEVLLRLHRCNVLGRFDGNIARLNTWMTNNIQLYVKTLLKRNGLKPFWDSNPTTPELKTARQHYERVLFSSINGVSPDLDGDLVPSDLADEEESENAATAREIVRRLKTMLPRDLKRLFALLENGNTIKDLRMLGGPMLVNVSLGALRSMAVEAFGPDLESVVGKLPAVKTSPDAPDRTFSAPSMPRFLHFEEARAYARSLRLETHEDWRVLCRSGNRPSNIPADPRRTYAKSGWNGWRDFFWGDAKPKSLKNKAERVGTGCGLFSHEKKQMCV